MANLTYDPILGVFRDNLGNIVLPGPDGIVVPLDSAGDGPANGSSPAKSAVTSAQSGTVTAITTNDTVTQTVTIPAGTILYALVSQPYEVAGTVLAEITLQGALLALPAATGYVVDLLKTGDTWHFNPGSTVDVNERATLQIDTILDNQSTIDLFGGTLTVAQSPMNFGAVDFVIPGSLFQLNAGVVSSGTIIGFSDTDRIVFQGLTSATATLSGTVLSVSGTTTGGGAVTNSFVLKRNDSTVYTQGQFTLMATTAGEILTTSGVEPTPVPVVAVAEARNYVNSITPVPVGIGVVVTDSGSATLASAIVDISGNYLAGDTLTVDTSGLPITSDFTAGVLTLTGVASLANYQTVLDSIRYSSTSADLTRGGALKSRVITWTVNDGKLQSNPVRSTLSLSQTSRILTWTGASNSDFNNVFNWNDITSGTAIGVQAGPTALDATVLTSNGGSLSSVGTVTSLQFGGPVGWSLGGTSTLTATGTAGVTVGGSLSLAAGATIISRGITDVVTSGSSQGANVSVSGSLSTWGSGGDLLIGLSGVGGLAVQNGGSVTVAGAATVANAASGSGSAVNVAGVGSRFGVGGALTIGNSGFGQLSVSQGGTVSAGSIDLGLSSGGAGVVTVSGTNTRVTTTGSVSVGDKGAGELSILNGPTVTIGGDLNIGQVAGGSGNVDVEDSAGTVIVHGNLNVGKTGLFAPAVLTLGVNAQFHVDGGINTVGFASANYYAQPDPVYGNNTSAITSNIFTTGEVVYSAYLNNTGAGGFLVNSGAIWTVDAPTIYGAAGKIVLGAGNAGLVLNADTVTGQTITLSDNTDTLVIGIDRQPTIMTPPSGTTGFTTVANPNFGVPSIGGFKGTIANFSVGDVITVDTTLAAKPTFSQITPTSSVVAVIANNTTLGVLTFDTAAAALLASTTPGALVSQQVAPCFAAGTSIETVDGPAAVETLRAGDTVRTVLGGSGRIVWVGSRAVDCTRHPDPASVWPVRIARDAFGEGLPKRALFVSPDHAIYVDGVLIPAKCLINGGTVRQVRVKRVVYHHIELERHDVVLAEGLPAETYLDTGDRARFSGGRVIALHPDFAARSWEMTGCAPLVVAGKVLETTRARLTAGAKARVRKAARLARR